MSWRIIIIVYVSAIPQCVSGNKPRSPYEVLEQYKFPVGLLPQGATGYSLEFSAHLNGSCIFTLEKSYECQFEPVIKGLISEGRLDKLSGASVKVVLLWLNIVEVRRNHQNLEFSVGFTSANFSIHNFEDCPRWRRSGGNSIFFSYHVI